MKWASTAALAMLLAVPLAALPAGQAAGGGAPLQWWGPDAIDAGFHMRVPVTVTNPHGYAVTNAPVAAELDLSRLLIDAGWTKASGGDRDLLAGFRLDPASVRVVAMTNLLPADNVNGRLQVVDTTFPGDDRRFEVPSTHIEGSLSAPREFDAAVDPVITVLWRVPATLQPAESRSFVIYFDSDRTSAPKAPRDDGLRLADGDLRSLFGAGPSVVAFGYVSPPQGGAGRIQVSSLHADTTIEVYTATVGATGSPVAPLQPLRGGHVFSIDNAYATLQVAVTTSGPVSVKVVADKPVIVQGASAGFIPSTDGGMTGRDFLFYTLSASTFEQDVLYVKAVDPRDEDGTLEQTRVNVTNLATGKTKSFLTRTEANPYDDTVSPRAMLVANGNPCHPPGASPYLDTAPALYRAQVVSGERVTLQFPPAGAVGQVPSSIGAPSGKDFWAAGPWTDDRPGESPNSCIAVSTTPAVWMSSALAAPGSGNITRPELAYQVSPPGDQNSNLPQARYPPGLAIPASPAVTSPATIAGRPAADRPLQVRTTTDSVVFLGTNPSPAGQAPLFGPFMGDDAGRVFTGLGRSLVYAPFAGTAVGVHSRYGQGEASAAFSIAAQGVAVIDGRSASDPLRSFRLESNRPILVTPTSASTGFFPGVPAMLSASLGPAEYRGYLIDLASDAGLDPVTGSTAPGTSLTHSLRLNNRAKALDGSPLPDLVKVEADVPAGWVATLDGIPLSPGQGPTLSLSGGESRVVVLSVAPPAGLESGKSGTITLRAMSQKNEMVQDSLDVVTFVKNVFDVGLWFDAIEGPKEQENRTMSPSGQAGFTLVVQNQGSRPETVRLATKFKAGETTWLARLGGADGDATTDVALAARQARSVRLTMQAPPGLIDGQATLVVTAEIVGVSGGSDAVQATAARRAPADLSLTTDGLSRFVLPGDNATFNLTIHNRGAGAANVLLDARSTPSPAWGPPRILVAGVPRADVAVDAGSTARVQVVVRASATALAGQSTTLRFSGRPEASGSGAMEAVMAGIVRPVHRLDIAAGPPLTLAPGENTSLTLRLTNQGNGDEDLLVRASSMPSGWRLAGDDEVLVPRGKTAPLRLEVIVPVGEEPMTGNITLELVSHDGHLSHLAIPVEVTLAANPTTSPVAGRAVQPGRLARAEVPVANDGNTGLMVTASAAQGEPWTLVPPPPLRLAAGERSLLQLAWQVPAAAADGPGVHRATLSFATQGVATVTTQVVEIAFDVGRPDLRLGAVTSVAGPSGRLVHTTVHNQGDRPGQNFTVTLSVDDEPVDELTIGELAPGASVEITLLQPRSGQASIAVDAAGAVVELDETNNRAVATGSAENAPAGSIALLAVAVAILAAWRRRQ